MYKLLVFQSTLAEYSDVLIASNVGNTAINTESPYLQKLGHDYHVVKHRCIQRVLCPLGVKMNRVELNKRIFGDMKGFSIKPL